MAKVILRQKAIDDLNDIWEYTFEQWSEVHADKYYSTLSFAYQKKYETILRLVANILKSAGI